MPGPIPACSAELLARVPALRADDVPRFTDWRGDPHEVLAREPDD